MSAASRHKGARYEREVVAWLRSHLWPFAERRIAGMADDRGDVTSIGAVVVECKDRREIALAAYVDQLADEIREAGAETGVVIVKRRGVSDVAKHYAVMTVDLWADLMVEAGRA